MTIRQQHVQLNKQTRNLRACYGGHCDQVMELVRQAASISGVTPQATAPEDHRSATGDRPTRITVLGAGNCNDVDLVWITHHFDEVHLVDLDADAIDHACAQPDIATRRVHRHCPVDFASPLVEICTRAKASSTKQLLDQWMQRIGRPGPDFPAPLHRPDFLCDVVVSVGLLSQLISVVTQTFAQLPQESVLSIVKAIRHQHFHRIERMLRRDTSDLDDPRPHASGHYRGGVAVLGLDFVSSDSAPELVHTPDAGLGNLAVELINRRNFFSGMNPAVSITELQKTPSVQLLGARGPWRWNLDARQYLVMGVLFGRL